MAYKNKQLIILLTILIVPLQTVLATTAASLTLLPYFAEASNPKTTPKRLTRDQRVALSTANSTAQKPEEQLKQFQLLEGFVIELVASEKDGVINPIDLTFDDAGRLWTQTARMYPLDPAFNKASFGKFTKMPEGKKPPELQRILDLYAGKLKGEDKILVIDQPHSQKPVTKVWADGLTIPQSILPYKNGAYVAQGTEIFYLSDKNDDGKADHREALYKGFGIYDTHTMTHTMVRAPGDWIHFSHGALNDGVVTAVKSGQKQRVIYSKIGRFSLNGEKIELVSSGLNNIWGFQLRHNGQWYGTEANDKGMSVVPMEEGTGYKGIGNDRLRSYQPWMPTIHNFYVGGTGISGLAFADDANGSFPKEWKDIAILANPITSTLNCVKIIRNEDGSVTSKHLPDLLVSKDKWFRPVNIEFGPDGCLYIADFYNKIISHNEISREHPDRDKKHGRIWRLRHVSQKPGKIPNLYKVPTAELPAYLSSGSLWAKRAAWHQIVDRQAKELIPEVTRIAGDENQTIVTRIHALWSLADLKHLDSELMKNLLAAKDGNLRREAVRALTYLPYKASERAELLKNFINDENAMVRSQVLRTINDSGEADQNIINILLSYCRPLIADDKMESGYQRRFERYLARKALELFPGELVKFLNADMAKKFPASAIQWASQALNKKEKIKFFLSQWPELKNQPVNDVTFLTIADIVDNKSVFEAVKPAFENEANASALAALANRFPEVQNKALAQVLAFPVSHLLKSGNNHKIKAALGVVDKFQLTSQNNEIQAIIKDFKAPPIITELGLQILAKTPQDYGPFLTEVITGNSPFIYKKIALSAIARNDAKAAKEHFKRLWSALSPEKKTDLINTLSQNVIAAKMLIELLGNGILKNDDFSIVIAERMSRKLRRNKQAKALFTFHQQKEAERKGKLKEKLNKFMAIAQKRGGNPQAGQPLFNALCLSCHSVGKTGAGIAPPLDGSAHREDEALLTAILDPDAAVESSYYTYSVEKKDGTSIAGLLAKEDGQGVTLKFMGGAEIFIPLSEIKSKRFLKRSYMPPGLIDNLGEQQVADILAYIRTLK